MSDYLSKQKQMHTTLVRSFKSLSGLQEHSNPYSHFDAFDDKRIVEYKWRNGRGYDSLILDKSKFDPCIRIAKEHDRQFWYVNYFDDHYYCFNISKLVDSDYLFDWKEVLANGKTAISGHSGNGVKVMKTTCLLPLDIAHITFSVGSDGLAQNVQKRKFSRVAP